MFDLQGHRGARGLWPENTLAGFAAAMELGVSALELDCGVTRDGVVVVSHDPELNPDCTRDAHGRFLATAGPAIFSLTYAQLQSYDVGRLRPGSAYAARFPHQQPVDGERIPRLADVLRLVRTRGRGRLRVAFEVKTFPEQPQLTLAPEPLVQALRLDVERTDTAALVVVLAFDWRVLSAVQRLMPQLPTAALTDQQPGEDTVRIGSPPSPGAGGLGPCALRRLDHAPRQGHRRRHLGPGLSGSRCATGGAGAGSRTARRSVDCQRTGRHGATARV